MTPVEQILMRYELPFEFYPYQADTINELAPRPKAGHYLAVGVGKTATSTGSTLFKFIEGSADRCIVLMPPILLRSWYRWVTSIKDKETKRNLTALIYRGTPAQRKKMKLREPQFLLMTYQIFKRDYDRIAAELDHARTVLISDEATAIKNIGSDNYKSVRDFSMDGHLMLLTGTPLNKLDDAYAYIKLVSPDIYRNKNHFNNLHVEELDFFGNPKTYINIDMLRENMKVNSVRLLKEDVLKDLPPITYSPIHYDLDPAHAALYRKLAEEQLLTLDDGSKIDATQATALWHSLQQIVMNHGHFAGDPALHSTGLELVDETMEELGDDDKLIVFTNYKLTSRLVTEYTKKYGSVAVFGDISAKQQDNNIERFMTDPTCRVLVAQVQSAGYGLNLQGVCSNVLFLEAPLVPIQFEQAVGRVYRNGQPNPVTIRVGIAVGTIQVHLHNQLLDKDAEVNQVVRSHADLRRVLYGEQ